MGTSQTSVHARRVILAGKQLRSDASVPVNAAAFVDSTNYDITGAITSFAFEVQWTSE